MAEAQAALFEKPNIFKRVFLSPLMLRELRVACRGWKLAITLTAYLLLQGAIFSIMVLVNTNAQGQYSDPASMGSTLFTTMSIVLVCVVMLVFPAFSSTAIAGEHERKSFDLLLLTPLAPWEIALGKFFAAGIQASIFLIATVPLFALASLFGGIEPGMFFFVLWVLVLLSLLISFIGVYASSLVQKATPAVLVTYLFALMFGIVLLTAFLILRFAPPIIPLLTLLKAPTFTESIFYVSAMTLTTSVYCTLLFLSTTNRLKPSSHNKSTPLRIFWTVAAMLMPTMAGGYFLFTRLPSHSMAMGSLVTTTIYFTLMMMVPAMAFPAEPPLPSRRVRRQIERIPAFFRALGGRLFFPGSAAGTGHVSILAAGWLALLVPVSAICFGKLNDALRDPGFLAERQRELGGAGHLTMLRATGAAIKTPADLVPILHKLNEYEHFGYLCLLAVLLVTILCLAQISWRISLSGLSRTIGSLLSAIILITWLAAPWIADQYISRGAPEENRVVQQFSPVAAAMNAFNLGQARGYAAVGSAGNAYEKRADSLQAHWWMYVGVTGFVTLILLGANIYSQIRLQSLLKRALAGGTQPQPAQPVSAYTPESGPPQS
ncbi:MAG: ABC transporter permease [Planctomycetes bacterium]|nr:ABC transporter permease [Planctomycetota bacterium]